MVMTAIVRSTTPFSEIKGDNSTYVLKSLIILSFLPFTFLLSLTLEDRDLLELP